MAIPCIVREMERIIGPKSRNFCTPPVFSAPIGAIFNDLERPLGLTQIPRSRHPTYFKLDVSQLVSRWTVASTS